MNRFLKVNSLYTFNFRLDGIAVVFILKIEFAFLCKMHVNKDASQSHRVNNLHLLLVCCRESSIWLSLGGFQEKGSDPQHLFNTHVVVDDTGKIRSTYRKIHL